MCICGSDVLSWLGADKHPDGSLVVETLPEEDFHFGERPEEHQVSIYGKQLLPHLQASHLTAEYNRIEEKRIGDRKVQSQASCFNIRSQFFWYSNIPKGFLYITKKSVHTPRQYGIAFIYECTAGSCCGFHCLRLNI